MTGGRGTKLFGHRRSKTPGGSFPKPAGEGACPITPPWPAFVIAAIPLVANITAQLQLEPTSIAHLNARTRRAVHLPLGVSVTTRSYKRVSRFGGGSRRVGADPISVVRLPE